VITVLFDPSLRVSLERIHARVTGRVKLSSAVGSVCHALAQVRKAGVAWVAFLPSRLTDWI
jgi:hypothetical protein